MDLTAPAFEPWERFMLLSLALEEVPRDAAADVLPHVTSAAMVVCRQLMGQRSRAEAYAHVERARAAVEAARRSGRPDKTQPNPTNPNDTRSA